MNAAGRNMKGGRDESGRGKDKIENAVAPILILLLANILCIRAALVDLKVMREDVNSAKRVI